MLESTNTVHINSVCHFLPTYVLSQKFHFLAVTFDPPQDRVLARNQIIEKIPEIGITAKSFNGNFLLLPKKMDRQEFQMEDGIKITLKSLGEKKLSENCCLRLFNCLMTKSFLAMKLLPVTSSRRRGAVCSYFGPGNKNTLDKHLLEGEKLSYHTKSLFQHV